MSDYTLTGPARRDLYQIWSYHDRIRDEQFANGRVQLIYQRFDLLSEHPFIGTASDIAPNLRRLTVPESPYIIFYYPQYYGVEIVRVIDGRRNPSRWFD